MGGLFGSIRKGNNLTINRMDTNDALRMIKRRAKTASLPYSTCCHTLRTDAIAAARQSRFRPFRLQTRFSPRWRSWRR